ncbi:MULTISPECIES: DUF397 domain-containing protein [Thermobifida]|uniref:DUF397 domain-containing protein n=1 Tax=Thermobifida TaxID=83677 RepID=UPI0009D714EE|nr:MULTISPECIES: DUF397 domain-containing protein [Thermobifida]MBO2528247.1 DUF397 domain-containing protein [Thermobifida sp.]MDD6793466.1 DUF397 domain-containing protein [Thermobifida fusca]PZN60225.1 MAG: DUF397 domain-containing protein [Thermobifida fusca]QOS60496.1 DUF397 domain-containing protein [Thermobifida fusca]
MKSLDWRKSSCSGGNAGACVEVAISWRKSSHSNQTGGNCVEVAGTPESVLVRDIQNRHLGHLGFIQAEWVAFLASVKNDRL